MAVSIGGNKELHPLHSISLQLASLSRENVPFSMFLHTILSDFVEPYECSRVALWLRQDGEYLKVDVDLVVGQQSLEIALCDALEGSRFTIRRPVGGDRHCAEREATLE